jgi:Ca2+-binding EF-hand superfamily protein
MDEDFSGKLEQKEFYDCLAAYDVSRERHRAGTKTFEQETLMKVSHILEKRQIEPVEIFNLCDADSSGTISLKELELFFEKLNIGL